MGNFQVHNCPIDVLFLTEKLLHQKRNLDENCWRKKQTNFMSCVWINKQYFSFWHQKQSHIILQPTLNGNNSKKPARKILSAIEIRISRAIFPLARGKIARKIQKSTIVKIYLAGFLESFCFCKKFGGHSKLDFN